MASYWPGFRRDDVLVRHLLSHTSGYAGWTEPLDVPGLLDLERSERMLAEQEPWWEPGTASGYHMISYGHLLDGLVRGATGVPLADQFRTLVAEPLGADFHLGVPEAVLRTVRGPGPAHRAGARLRGTARGQPAGPDDREPAARRGEPSATRPSGGAVSVAGVNGHGSARSIARAQSVVSHGGEVGRRTTAVTGDRRPDLRGPGRRARTWCCWCR